VEADAIKVPEQSQDNNNNITPFSPILYSNIPMYMEDQPEEEGNQAEAPKILEIQRSNLQDLSSSSLRPAERVNQRRRKTVTVKWSEFVQQNRSY
jgi:hypothetical protein